MVAVALRPEWDWPRLARHGFLLGAGVYVALVAAGVMAWGTDAPIWWAARAPDPYAHAEYVAGVPGFFYSPAFAQALAPFQWLPEPVFVAGWTALLFAALYAMTGRYAIAALLFPPVALDIWTGNVHVLFALVAVFGLGRASPGIASGCHPHIAMAQPSLSSVAMFAPPGRSEQGNPVPPPVTNRIAASLAPALWAFPLLTKVTPGIGLVWFAVRKEWPQLAVGVGVTAAIVGVSFLLTPGAWFEWVGLLSSNVGADVTYPHVPIPMLYRLPFALLLIVWGARTDRRWTVPVAMLLSLPVIWPGSFALLAAIPWESARPIPAPGQLR
jgi:hypothetical protein